MIGTGAITAEPRLLRGLVAAVLVVLPPTAYAQETMPDGVAAVFVQRADTGDELRGHVLRLEHDTMTLLVEGQRVTLPMSSVTRIDTPGDPVRNGALIGAIIGGTWCALVCGQALDSSGALPIGVVINAAFWGGIGAGIDALIPGRKTIYRRPPGASAHARISYRVRF